MTIPYREWQLCNVGLLEAHYPTPPGTKSSVSNWTSRHLAACLLGEWNTGNLYDWHWRAAVRPRSYQGFESMSGMDEIIDIETKFFLNAFANPDGKTAFEVVIGILDNANAWIKGKVTGKHYDGVNQWDNYPPLTKHTDSPVAVTVADLPKVYTHYNHSYVVATGAFSNMYQADFFRNGIEISLSSYVPGMGADEKFQVYCWVQAMRVRFLNAIVNNISRFWAPTAGGVEVVLTGLGFKNSDAELDGEGDSNPGDHAVGWEDNVLYIDFIGLQGQGTTRLGRLVGDGAHFTVDSNTQITIAANKFPALSKGSYEIKLIKRNYGGISDPESYAGDWACDSDGRVYSSTRISFYISDLYIAREVRERKAPILLIDCHLKAKSDGSEIMKYYSMDYVKCPDRIYKASLSAISTIPRGIDDKTGLFKITDITLDLANNKLEFSKLLAGTTILKNQLVKIYQAYPDEPFGWRSHIMTTIIDDYDLEGEIFKLKLKDITQKYFRRNVPHNVCYEDYEINATDDYSNIHPDSNGAPVSEILGLCSLTTGEFRGQIEAICIDTVNYKYVAANRTLKEITEVYADDIVAIDSADYTISYEEDGRTYITFNADQGDKKVTFNCKGYVYGGMNSDNGYIQNPAYIALYFLLVILEIPSTLIDFQSFDDLADILVAMGEDESGKLILQNQRNPLDVLEGLIPGFSCFPAKDGRIKVGKKDMSNYKTNNGVAAPAIFSQFEMIEGLKRKYNMRDAITVINADFDYIPTWDLFKSNVSKTAEVRIDPWDPVEVIFEDDRRTPDLRGRRSRPIRSWAR